MGSMRLVRVSERWRSYQEKSPFYRQVAADGEESVWSEIAETYDRTCYPGNQKPLILSSLLPYVDRKGSGIEIGPGPGTFTLSLAETLDRLTVFEPSTSMRRVLEKRLADSGIDNVDIRREKWENAWKDSSVRADYVFALGCLYAFYRIEDALFAMLRAAKKRVVLCHIAGEGLWEIDYRVAKASALPPPCFFPPVELLVETLSAMSCDFRTTAVHVPIRKKLRFSELTKRYRRMFDESTPDEQTLERTFRENLKTENGIYSIRETACFVLIAAESASLPPDGAFSIHAASRTRGSGFFSP